jgi:hypothetical protein
MGGYVLRACVQCMVRAWGQPGRKPEFLIDAGRPSLSHQQVSQQLGPVRRVRPYALPLPTGLLS